MADLPLFPNDDASLPPQAARLAPKLRSLAERDIFFGTSSWKYEGWCDQIYTREKYLTRNKFSKKKFEAECLAEYARTFPIVGGDFSFYRFPTNDYWAKLFAESPAGLRFALKVPEDITINRWPGHARYGKRAGTDNEDFLDAEKFSTHFASPLELYQDRVACAIFEFGTSSKKDFDTPGDFADSLEEFLGGLPKGGMRYAVEIRNKDYLTPDYFEALATQKIAHVFNAWTRMPTIGDQMQLPEAFTTEFTVVRALLKHGRSYEQAVKMFEPYDRTQEPDEPTRDSLRSLVGRSLKDGKSAFILVNNRLEGNAPSTIEAVVSPFGD